MAKPKIFKTALIFLFALLFFADTTLSARTVNTEIHPLIECIQELNEGNYHDAGVVSSSPKNNEKMCAVHFGYNNLENSDVHIPHGKANRLWLPSSLHASNERIKYKNPSKFHPGVNVNAFEVVIPCSKVSHLKWNLSGNIVHASDYIGFECPKDCKGNAFGKTVVDECGVCGGNGSTCADGENIESFIQKVEEERQEKINRRREKGSDKNPKGHDDDDKENGKGHDDKDSKNNGKGHKENSDSGSSDDSNDSYDNTPKGHNDDDKENGKGHDDKDSKNKGKGHKENSDSGSNDDSNDSYDNEGKPPKGHYDDEKENGKGHDDKDNKTKGKGHKDNSDSGSSDDSSDSYGKPPKGHDDDDKKNGKGHDDGKNNGKGHKDHKDNSDSGSSDDDNDDYHHYSPEPSASSNPSPSSSEVPPPSASPSNSKVHYPHSSSPSNSKVHYPSSPSPSNSKVHYPPSPSPSNSKVHYPPSPSPSKSKVRPTRSSSNTPDESPEPSPYPSVYAPPPYYVNNECPLTLNISAHHYESFDIFCNNDFEHSSTISFLFRYCVTEYDHTAVVLGFDEFDECAIQKRGTCDNRSPDEIVPGVHPLCDFFNDDYPLSPKWTSFKEYGKICFEANFTAHELLKCKPFGSHSKVIQKKEVDGSVVLEGSLFATTASGDHCHLNGYCVPVKIQSSYDFTISINTEGKAVAKFFKKGLGFEARWAKTIWLNTGDVEVYVDTCVNLEYGYNHPHGNNNGYSGGFSGELLELANPHINVSSETGRPIQFVNEEAECSPFHLPYKCCQRWKLKTNDGSGSGELNGLKPLTFDLVYKNRTSVPVYIFFDIGIYRSPREVWKGVSVDTDLTLYRDRNFTDVYDVVSKKNNNNNGYESGDDQEYQYKHVKNAFIDCETVYGLLETEGIGEHFYLSIEKVRLCVPTTGKPLPYDPHYPETTGCNTPDVGMEYIQLFDRADGMFINEDFEFKELENPPDDNDKAAFSFIAKPLSKYLYLIEADWKLRKIPHHHHHNSGYDNSSSSSDDSSSEDDDHYYGSSTSSSSSSSDDNYSHENEEEDEHVEYFMESYQHETKHTSGHDSCGFYVSCPHQKYYDHYSKSCKNHHDHESSSDDSHSSDDSNSNSNSNSSDDDNDDDDDYYKKWHRGGCRHPHDDCDNHHQHHHRHHHKYRRNHSHGHKPHSVIVTSSSSYYSTHGHHGRWFNHRGHFLSVHHGVWVFILVLIFVGIYCCLKFALLCSWCGASNCIDPCDPNPGQVTHVSVSPTGYHRGAGPCHDDPRGLTKIYHNKGVLVVPTNTLGANTVHYHTSALNTGKGKQTQLSPYAQQQLQKQSNVTHVHNYVNGNGNNIVSSTKDNNYSNDWGLGSRPVTAIKLNRLPSGDNYYDKKL